MKIVNLIENTEGKNACRCEHGLSFYIETKKHKLLADTGASDAFLENASQLGVDLKKVDTCFLSHGHYDHAGGIMAFAKLNPVAKILMSSLAGNAYYHVYPEGEKYIGIQPEILTLPQTEFISENKRVDEELFVFSGVTGRKYWPEGNRVLAEKVNNLFLQDEFKHEQYLVITEADKRVLISGCAHNGILNILEKYQEIFGEYPNVVISGFHLMKKSGYSNDDIELIRTTAEELNKTNITFYTGHCTGEIPFQIMKEIMGEKLNYVHSGDSIRLD
ncbi:MAG: MBL fold metallo-hydrolase [Lachnospiraceae bacterium]|nr:MBL fold metallo-hydrolase [Lachnospiraceae bacterium]